MADPIGHSHGVNWDVGVQYRWPERQLELNFGLGSKSPSSEWDWHVKGALKTNNLLFGTRESPRQATFGLTADARQQRFPYYRAYGLGVDMPNLDNWAVHLEGEDTLTFKPPPGSSQAEPALMKFEFGYRHNRVALSDRNATVKSFNGKFLIKNAEVLNGRTLDLIQVEGQSDPPTGEPHLKAAWQFSDPKTLGAGRMTQMFGAYHSPVGREGKAYFGNHVLVNDQKTRNDFPLRFQVDYDNRPLAKEDPSGIRAALSGQSGRFLSLRFGVLAKNLEGLFDKSANAPRWERFDPSEGLPRDLTPLPDKPGKTPPPISNAKPEALPKP